MLLVKISSKNVAVATIDYSEMEELRKGGLLSTKDILKKVEDAIGKQLPYYDIIYNDATKRVIDLVKYVDSVEYKEL